MASAMQQSQISSAIQSMSAVSLEDLTEMMGSLELGEEYCSGGEKGADVEAVHVESGKYFIFDAQNNARTLLVVQAVSSRFAMFKARPLMEIHSIRHVDESYIECAVKNFAAQKFFFATEKVVQSARDMTSWHQR